jgi:hypothetical protein
MVDVFGVVVVVLDLIRLPMNAFAKMDIIKLALTSLDEEFVPVSINCIFIQYFSFFFEVCPKPYHVLTTDGRCVWSCGSGTQPDSVTNECVCTREYHQTGFDQFGRRVCSL